MVRAAREKPTEAQANEIASSSLASTNIRDMEKQAIEMRSRRDEIFLPLLPL